MEDRRPSAERCRSLRRRALRGEVTRTPLLPLDWEGRRIWVKAECLQRGGSFKLRGATNRLMLLDASRAGARRGRFLLRQSCPGRGAGGAGARHSGDHRHARRRAGGEGRGDARGAGAEIVFFDRATESREEIGARLAAEQGATLVPSFDDVDVIEGQGSVGVEIAAQLGAAPPMVVVPCGGGGLSGGIALALPELQVIAVEPEGWDDMARSLGRRRDRAGRGAGAAEPLRRAADEAGFAADLRRAREAGANGVAVSEEEVAEAMRFAFRNLRIVAEPGGAVALAALIAGKVDAPDGIAWSSFPAEMSIRRFMRRSCRRAERRGRPAG